MDESTGKGLDRRAFVRRAAIAGAAGIWVPPVVEAFVLTPAHAATPSDGSGTGGTGGHGTEGTSAHNPSGNGGGSGTDGASAGGSGTAASSASDQPLAETGPSVPIAGGVIAGTAAVVVGAAAVAAGRTRQPKSHEA